jgi:6,7-dimethyl-8-ribityllumazine synthase
MVDTTVKGLKPAAVPADGRGLRVGVVRTRWNDQIIEALRQGCLGELAKLGAEAVEREVAGAFELPLAAKLMIEHDKVDAVRAVAAALGPASLEGGLLGLRDSSGVVLSRASCH